MLQHESQAMRHLSLLCSHHICVHISPCTCSPVEGVVLCRGSKIALHIASGLLNLHKANVVHSDLHSGNVVLDDNAKITGLGLSFKLGLVDTESIAAYGPSPYAAPERVRDQLCFALSCLVLCIPCQVLCCPSFKTPSGVRP
jgi:serine/threonine protein kinase